MSHPYKAIVRRALSVVPAGGFLAVFVFALGLSAQVEAEPPDQAKDEEPAEIPASVEVFGKVVDDETGKPVAGFIVQGGKFDPKDPKNVTWGFHETRGGSTDFRTTIQWKEGWTARILADGYIPQPLLSEAPRGGKDRIEKVIRLKKGRTVRGRVLDHLDKPVKGASVFPLRPMGMTFAQGKAVNSYDGEEDKTARGVKTDANGRFELTLSVAAEPKQPAGDDPAPATEPKVVRPGLAVSSPAIDVWPVPLPEGNEAAVIRLPAPTRVEIDYDIEGGEEEASVFLQSVMFEVEAWKGVEIIRHLTVKNQERIELTSLPPGRYQFARSRSLRHGNIGQGHFLDRQFVEVASEKTTPVTFVRTSGARLTGSVEWEEGTKLTGIIISVRKAASPDDPPAERRFPPVFDARLLRVGVSDDEQGKAEIVGNVGLFLTERIPPGTYDVQADGYAPLTEQQQRRTGMIGPTLTAQATVTVPESGKVPSLKLKLKKR